MKKLLLMATAFGMISGSAIAQTSPQQGAAAPATATGTSATATANTQAMDAQTFVTMAGSSGLYEVMSSQLAMKQATDANVMNFAQQMVADHTKANAELKQIADQQGLTVPTDLDPQHQSMLDQLRGSSGAGFEKQYVDQQVQAHEEAVVLFSAQATAGEDETLKGFAAKTLPILEQHLEMVRKLQS